MNCKFCAKHCKNDNSLRNHQRLCRLNPEKQTTPFQDSEKQKEIASKRKPGNQWSIPGYSMTDDTKRKMSESSRKRNEQETETTRQKRIDTINRKVAAGEWHTSLAAKMHKTYNGEQFHGTWEVAYAKFLDSVGTPWDRNTRTFVYEFDGKTKRYTPDFYLPLEDVYVEIKGYKTEKDIAKWDQFPETLVVLMRPDLTALGII